MNTKLASLLLVLSLMMAGCQSSQQVVAEAPAPAPEPVQPAEPMEPKEAADLVQDAKARCIEEQPKVRSGDHGHRVGLRNLSSRECP